MICIDLRTGQLRSIRLAQIEVWRTVDGSDDDSAPPLHQTLELAGEDVLAGKCPADFLDVLRVHAREPGVLVEPRGCRAARHRRSMSRARARSGQQRRARERMRAAARGAGDAEASEAELVGEQHAHPRPRRPRDGRGADPTSHNRRGRASPRQTPSSTYSSSCGHRTRREPGVPCIVRIGNPPGSPQTANATVRPSGVSSVRSGSPTRRAYGRRDNCRRAGRASPR